MKSNKHLKWIAALLVLLVIVVAIVSTNIHKTVQNQPAPSAVDIEYRDFGSVTDEQLNNGKLNICLITKGYDNDYWDILIQGAIDAADESDVNLYVAGVKQEGSVDKQTEILEEAYQMEPDAIIVSPQDTAKIVKICDQIQEKDIPLIFVDTILNGRYFDACFMTDNMEAGRMVAKDMLIKLRTVGHKEADDICVGIDIGSNKSQTIIERLAGFNEYWSNHAPENWEVLEDIQINNGSSDVAYTQCLEFIDKNENLAGLIGLNNGSTVGLCRGLVERDRKDIVLVGFDYSKDISSLIKNEEYHVSTMVQLQYNMGYEGVKTAIDLCNGEKPLFKYINTGVSKVDHNNYNSPYIKQNVLRE